MTSRSLVQASADVEPPPLTLVLLLGIPAIQVSAANHVFQIALSSALIVCIFPRSYFILLGQVVNFSRIREILLISPIFVNLPVSWNFL